MFHVNHLQIASLVILVPFATTTFMGLVVSIDHLVLLPTMGSRKLWVFPKSISMWWPSFLCCHKLSWFDEMLNQILHWLKPQDHHSWHYFQLHMSLPLHCHDHLIENFASFYIYGQAHISPHNNNKAFFFYLYYISMVEILLMGGNWSFWFILMLVKFTIFLLLPLVLDFLENCFHCPFLQQG